MVLLLGKAAQLNLYIDDKFYWTILDFNTKSMEKLNFFDGIQIKNGLSVKMIQSVIFKFFGKTQTVESEVSFPGLPCFFQKILKFYLMAE
jgi:hypothetical protein